MSTLRRPTNQGANASPGMFKPQGGANDRYCMKCNCWRPQKGGKQVPGLKLWVCALDHKALKTTTTPQEAA